MSVSSPYLIEDLPGFAPHISRLVVMMNYARQTTLEAVEGLSVSQLDHFHDKQSNSIGALLFHIAAVEVDYQIATLEEREPTGDEKKLWMAGLELGERAQQEIKGNDLEYYLELLKKVRDKTLSAFAKRSDDWLYRQTPFWDDLLTNNYFIWFHVMEDEINHRGQIRWLRRRLPRL